jgi:hypothetical protein
MAFNFEGFKYYRERPGEYADLSSQDPGFFTQLGVYNAFMDLKGRAPTEAEITKYLPAFTADANQGRALLVQEQELEDNSPDKLAARRDEQLSAQAGQYGGKVGELVKSATGRDATAAELNHFGKLLASKEVDEYELQGFLKQLPEARQREDETFRGQQRDEFAKADTKFFQENLLPAIQSDFARRGRSVDSSGFASALSEAARKQAQERENYLTQMSAGQYAGRTGAAREDYMTYMDRYYGNQTYNRARGDELSDRLYGQRSDLGAYSMQKQAYDEYLRKYGKRSNPAMGAASGAMSGAAAGSVAGPWGAGLGAIAGGAMGYFGSK